MKKLLWLLLIGAAFGQCNNTTANLALNIPGYNCAGWNTLLNSNFSSLDSFLSGGSILPAFKASALTLNGTGLTSTAGSFSGNVGITGNTTIGGTASVGGNVTLTGVISSYNGIVTVGHGVPALYAQFDTTGQSSNIGTQTLFTPATSGFYRVSAYIIITQVATNSSTLPTVGVFWTDADNVTPLGGATTTTLTGNVLTTAQQSSTIVNAKAGTPIQFDTASYASNGATPMQYALHIRLESF
jgi:hypothetical protein